MTWEGLPMAPLRLDRVSPQATRVLLGAATQKVPPAAVELPPLHPCAAPGVPFKSVIKTPRVGGRSTEKARKCMSRLSRNESRLS